MLLAAIWDQHSGHRRRRFHPGVANKSEEQPHALTHAPGIPMPELIKQIRLNGGSPGRRMSFTTMAWSYHRRFISMAIRRPSTVIQWRWFCKPIMEFLWK